MNRGGLAVAAVGVSLALLGGAADANDRSRTWTSCAANSGRQDRECFVGDAWGGEFRAMDGGRTRYRLCVDPPQAQAQCRYQTTGSRGRDFVKVFRWFGSGPLGRYEFVWRRGGHQLDKDSMTLLSKGAS
jgi:hypothetical protein